MGSSRKVSGNDEQGMRLQILEATERCFRQFGSYKTTLQDVAGEAKVSRRTVYRYFGDREGLVSAFIEHRSDTFLNELERVFDTLSSLQQRLEAFASLAVRTSLKGRGSPTALVDEETVAHQLTMRGQFTMAKSIDFLAPYFREAKRSGEIRRSLNVGRASEWAVRMIISLASTPSVTVDLTNDKEVRAFVRGHVIRGFQ